jgi:hypothetical protein
MPQHFNSFYYQDYQALKDNFNLNLAEYAIGTTQIYNVGFESLGIASIFPNDRQYYAPKLGGSTLNLNAKLFGGDLDQLIQISDAEVAENQRFIYTLVSTEEPRNLKGLIFLFHGLNEKDWTKYLPWAKILAELTGMGVLLFPLAFHINRALPPWQDSRMMNVVSKKRMELFFGMSESSFTNAAMSTRLHFSPVRFFYSGLATYYDVIQLVKQIKSGQHSLFSAQTNFHFLGYSAGAFLAQIILMANRDDLFSQSKAILFCGGPLLTRMHLTSRYIMDSEAHQAILDYYTDNFDRNIEADFQLNQLFESARRGGIYFRSMLSESYSSANQLRKQRLAELKNQMLAIALKQDNIMPPHEIQASLLDLDGNLAIPCEIWDFEYPYSHMMPFPYLEKIKDEVDNQFKKIFGRMAEFFTETF